MKKIIVFGLLLAAGAAVTQAQTSVRMNQESVGLFTIAADTMQIVKADQIVKFSVYCPTGATDSVHVSGATFTLSDGHATNSIVLPPGETAINLGFDYAYSDTVRIIADNKAWIMLLKKR